MIKLSILSLLLALIHCTEPQRLEDEFSIFGEWQLKTYSYPNMEEEEPFEVNITFTFKADGTMEMNDANGDIFTSSYEFDGKDLTYAIEEEQYSCLVSYLASEGRIRAMIIEFISPFEARYVLTKL